MARYNTKVKFKVSRHLLDMINEDLEEMLTPSNEQVGSGTEKNLVASILLDIHKKFMKSPTSDKKKFTISLKYHEAVALDKFTSMMMYNHEKLEYNQVLLLELRSNIQPQLQ